MAIQPSDRFDAPLPRRVQVARNGTVVLETCVCDAHELCFLHAWQRDGARPAD